MEKKIYISYIRVVSMLLIIVGCHLVGEIGMKYDYLIGNFAVVGVYLFLFISGYLYSNKEIKDCKKFYKTRFLKIILPMYVFMFFYFIIQVFLHKFEFKYIFIFLSNLQYYLGAPIGTGHLWFVSVIFICYLILPIFKCSSTKKIVLFEIVLFLLGMFVGLYNKEFGRTFFYIFTFFCGYICSMKEVKPSVILMYFLLALSVFLRLILRIYLDGTNFYGNDVYSITNIIMCFSSFYILKDIIIKTKLKNNKVIDHLDKMSYFMYITHYMFIVGPVVTLFITNNLILNMILTFISIYLSAILLHSIYNFLLKKVIR